MSTTIDDPERAPAEPTDPAGVDPALTSPPSGNSNRFWLQDVAVEVLALQGELTAIEARHASEHGQRTDETHGIVTSVRHLLRRAEDAAKGLDPPHRRFRSWWTGDCVEAAFRSMHRAEAEIARLYDQERAESVAHEAFARLEDCVPSGDPRRVRYSDFKEKKGRAATLALSKAIQIGHESKDQQYSKVRRFRNIVLSASALIVVFLALFAIIVSKHPDAVPLCFADPKNEMIEFCPTSEGLRHASGGDVWIVILLGLLGGSLAAAVSIRNIRGAPTPYNLATALALLKVPAGALTAVGALVLIGGNAVPGLSSLDSQEQILAYALVFGYAQQLLTGLIDRRALDVVANVRGKGPENERRSGSASPS